MGISNPIAFPVKTDSNILVSCKMLTFKRFVPNNFNTDLKNKKRME